MTHTHIDLLTHKELIGDISKSELYVLNSLREDELNRIESSLIKSIWDASAYYEPKVSFDTTNGFADLMTRIQYEQNNTVFTSQSNSIIQLPKKELHSLSTTSDKKMFSLRTISTIAAACAILLVGYIAMKNFGIKSVSSGSDPMELALADGSKLILAPHTEIQMNKAFERYRTVDLIKGKVHFDVAKMNGQPFNVNTAGLAVKVLGTSFTVNDEINTVSVNSGKVAITSNNETMVLTKGEKLIFKDNVLALTTIDNDDKVWFKEPLVFNNTALDKVIDRMNEYYDVNITYKGTRDLSSCTITSNLDGSSLENALALIKVSLSLDIEIDKTDKTQINFSNAKCR